MKYVSTLISFLSFAVIIFGLGLLVCILQKRKKIVSIRLNY